MKGSTIVKDIEELFNSLEKGKDISENEKNKIYSETVEYTNNNLNPGWLGKNELFPVLEWADEGECFYDINYECYNDFLGGYGIFTAGHRNKEILKYTLKQMERQPLSSCEWVNPYTAYISKIMADITPGDLQYCLFGNGGAEAVEIALKLAKLSSQKQWIISAANAFHGKTMGALSATGQNIYRRPYLPLIQNTRHVKHGDIQDLKNTIENIISAGDDIAAVILEPIQGAAGIILPPKEYLKEVREICSRENIILIIDEIQTGLARTGTMWRCEAEDIIPDILVFGKAFGGGITPSTGIIARPFLINDRVKNNASFWEATTFGGNPMASVASLAAIKYMLENDIPDICKKKGEKIKEILKELQIKYPDILLEYRGEGLFIGMDFPSNGIGKFILNKLMERHYLLAGTFRGAKTLRIEPPAVISYEAIDGLGRAMEEVLSLTEKEFFQGGINNEK